MANLFDAKHPGRQDARFARVAMNLPVRREFDYRVPRE